MTLPENVTGRNTPGADSVAPARQPLPPELTSLNRWACWRSRTKTCQDRYKDGIRTAERVVYEALHPTTGRALAVSRPDAWVSYDSATQPQARKPFEGLALLVRQEDGLAVLRHAQHDVLDRLGGNALHAEQEVDGDGLVVIVRAGVFGAKTDVFVPLSGRTPYQTTATSPCPDGEDAVSGWNPDGNQLSGRSPYQESSSVRTEPVPASSVCPDGTRTFFSSSLKNNYQDDEPDRIRREVEEYARVVCEQEKAEDSSKWVYGLIGVFKRNGLTPQTIPTHLLLSFAEGVREDVGAVQRRVLAGWSRWKAHKVPLPDALRAVHADPSLLTDISSVLTDRAMLLAAGMCAYMGSEGLPFALPGRVLAEVLGLRGQQEGSEVVRALVSLGLIRQVKAGSYAAKLAAEYIWVGAQAKSVPPQPPADTHSTSTVAVSSRPGHSHEQTEKCRFRSKLGGFLTDEHYLAEMMLARKLGREGRELFAGFWTKPDLGAEYGRQVVAARSLLTHYSITAVCRALRSKEGGWVYSLATTHLVEVLKAEQTKLDRQQARRECEQEVETTQPVPSPVAPGNEAPRPHFSLMPSIRQKLSGL